MKSNISQPDSSRPISIKEIFLAAREVTAGESRDRYLTEVVGEDQDLRRRIDRMLASEDCSNPKPLAQVVDNLDLAAYDVTTVPAIDVSEHPLIGPYKLLERLGTGGMGEVFVAEQRKPVRRTVALKLIKRGMDSKEVIARFEAERQALALMNHPNIASVLDVGHTEDGRPYFVMDVVRGVSITKYCDRHKLDLRQRLELMVTVCQAVQHAHQKGIIHRDLKPGNILVELDDVRHVPKIIDFGVAKATNQRLTERTLFTQFSQIIGTPAYMSPEQTQLTSLDVDTRSDVYSLGVVLYKLLTGSTPFDKKTLNTAGFDEMRRIIREDEPPRPSHRISTLKAEQDSTLTERQQRDAPQLFQQVEAELDWIVMKALEKDRIRRYESASALAADVQRFLDGDLVQACPPSVGYRFRKYFAKRKGLLTTAVLLLVTMLIATGVSVSYAVQADRTLEESDLEKNNAIAAQIQSEKNLTAALDAVDKLLEHASNPALREIPQVQPIRQKILGDVLEFYGQFKITTGDSPTLRFRAAMAWWRLGGLGRELDQLDQARNGYDQALKLLEELVEQSPDVWEYQNYHMRVSMGYGHLHLAGDRQEAQKHFERVRTRADKLLLNASEDQPTWIRKLLRRNQVQARRALSHVAAASGDDAAYRKLVLDAYQNIDGDFDAIPAHDSVALLAEMAHIHQDSDPIRADEYYRIAVARSRHSLQQESTRDGRAIFASLLWTASLFFQQQDADFGEELQRESTAIRESLVSEFPEIPVYHRLLAQQLAEGADSIVRLTKAVKQNPEISCYYAFRGNMYYDRGEYELALVDLDRAIEFDSSAWLSYRFRGSVHSRTGKHALALADYDKAIELNPKHSWSWCGRAKLFMSHFQKYEEALSDFNHAIELTREPHFIEYRAKSHFHLNQYDKALADLNTALDLEPKTPAIALSIAPDDVASCSNEEFRAGMRALADRAVELNNNSAAALKARTRLLAALGD